MMNGIERKIIRGEQSEKDRMVRTRVEILRGPVVDLTGWLNQII